MQSTSAESPAALPRKMAVAARASDLCSEDRNWESCATVSPRMNGEDAEKSATFASLTLIATRLHREFTIARVKIL